MRVFLLRDQPEYEPGATIGVFSTLEEAQAGAREVAERWTYTNDLSILEWEVDGEFVERHEVDV